MTAPFETSAFGTEAVRLSRPYAGRPGVPIVEYVEIDIFRLSYFQDCMRCDFCHDSCCQYGATIESDKMAALLARADELEPVVGRPRTDWFEDWVEPDPEYPGGTITRTRVVDGACVFLSRRGRGCLLHAYSLAQGEPVAGLKPLVCMLFPVLFEDATLIVPAEIEDRSLVCLGTGPSLYRGARADLEEFFGPNLVAELDAVESLVLAERPPVRAGTTTSLPVIPVWRPEPLVK